eukprot:200007_1
MSAIVDAPINTIGLVKEYNLKNEKIFTCHHEMLAKDAFKQFLVHRCDVIAIINDEKQIVSHISESDIIGLGPEAISFLVSDEYLTVYHFMNAVNKENGRQCDPICCKKDEILSMLMKMIVETESNHIWIVDDDRKPIKLVTLNDIICKFSPYDYKETKCSKRLSLIRSGNKKDITTVLETLNEKSNETDSSSD